MRMRHMVTNRPTWRQVLEKHGQLLLPVAHDALTARIIETSGLFPAFQIGGFALSGAMYGVPDIAITHFYEEALEAFNIIAATKLPVMVDSDTGYGDVKSVVRAVQGYEKFGAAAMFIEDQVITKKCGHMDNKEVISSEEMQMKIRTAVAARASDDFFFLARTDSLQTEGVSGAIARGELYLDAGADGIYVEGPRTVEELEKIGRAFKGTPLATSVLEGGGKTPFLSPAEFREIGFTMVLYPTTVIFQSTRAVQRALATLAAGQPMPKEDAVTTEEFQQIVDIDYWKGFEEQFKTVEQAHKEQDLKDKAAQHEPPKEMQQGA
jgi:2-methylisocitrate lyase-like PEP mutase family enzyme